MAVLPAVPLSSVVGASGVALSVVVVATGWLLSKFTVTPVTRSLPMSPVTVTSDGLQVRGSVAVTLRGFTLIVSGTLTAPLPALLNAPFVPCATNEPPVPTLIVPLFVTLLPAGTPSVCAPVLITTPAGILVVTVVLLVSVIGGLPFWFDQAIASSRLLKYCRWPFTTT